VTLPCSDESTCAVCGAASEQTSMLSTNTFGAPDLDARPPEMLRSTIAWWVHECPGCGYCAEDLGEAPAGAAEVVRSQAYRQQLDDPRAPELARRFLCAALIAEADRGPGAPALVQALVNAAWACDDAEDAEGAVRCRLRAASALGALRAAGGSYMEGDPSEDDTLLADLYRRTGSFEEAGAAARAGLAHAVDGFHRGLLELQLRLISARDVSAHACDEVVADQPE